MVHQLDDVAAAVAAIKERRQELPDVGLGFGTGAVRGVAVVDPHHGAVGHDIAGHAAFHMHGLERLAVPTAVHHGFAVRVRLEGRQQGAKTVHRVSPHPRPGGVGPDPGEGHLKTHRALASGLDCAGGRLSQDGDVAGQQFRCLGEELTKAVVEHRHLLAGVEDPGHVHRRFPDHAGQLQHHGQAALHVGRAQPPEDVPVEA